MILMISSHLMTTPKMLLSSSYVLIFLLCLSHECTGRHLSTIDDLAMDDNAKLLSHSTNKGFENTSLIVHDDLNLKMAEKGNDQTSKVNNDHHKKTDCKPENKKDMKKDEKLKNVEEEWVHHNHHHHHHHHHHPKSQATVTFRVPPRNKRVNQQPGFNLDYSPPKTHPPSHN